MPGVSVVIDHDDIQKSELGQLLALRTLRRDLE